MNKCAFFVSQYSWLVFVCVSAVLVFACVDLRNDPGVVVGSTEIHGDSSDPFVFAHVSDVHVDASRPISSRKLDKIMEEIMLLGIQHVVISGDLVENFVRHGKIKFGKQMERDFIEYQKIMAPYIARNMSVIDIAGNHDEFGVGKFDAPSHHILKYSNYYSKHNMTLNKFWVSKQIWGDVELLIVNPFAFPQASSLIGYRVHPQKVILDAIEKELMKPRQGRYRVFVSHYSFQHVRSFPKSSRGHTYLEIAQNAGPVICVTGHGHPSEPMPIHYNGMLEVVGVDVIEHMQYGIVAIDNGRITYHEPEIGKPKGIILRPVPKAQVSSSVNFNELKGEVRVLIFATEPLNILASGSVTGQLSLTKHVNNVSSLYSLPYTLDMNGEYTIHFSGDWEGSVTFVVGEKVKLDKEDVIDPERKEFMFLAMFVVLSVMWMIVIFPCGEIPLATKMEEAIESDTGVTTKDMVLIFVFGFLCIRDRIQRREGLIKWTLLASYLLMVFMPFFVAPFESGWLVVMLYGYFIGRNYNFDTWGYTFGFFYLITTVVPASCIVSSTSFHTGIYDIVFAMVGLGGLVACLLFFVYQSGDTYAVFMSPLFVAVPISLYITVLVYRVQQHRQRRHHSFQSMELSEGAYDVLVTQAGS